MWNRPTAARDLPHRVRISAFSSARPSFAPLAFFCIAVNTMKSTLKLSFDFATYYRQSLTSIPQ